MFAVALIPDAARGPLPIILIRTPFDAAREFSGAALPPALRELGKDGYIFVTEDIRGRYHSAGQFVTNRAQDDPRNPKGTNESTDAYDTIDWLVNNLPDNSGKVGVLGISYRGWLAGLAGVGAHPALKAISPQAPTTDTWLGDDFFHQGAFRQTQGLAFSAFVESDRGLSIPDHDQYDFYLRYPTVDSLAKATGVNLLQSWVGFRLHPAYDSYWQAKAMENVLTRPEVPILFVGGWWDAEDILGPELAYRTVEQHDPGNINRIVLGPWVHGEWARPGGDSIGPIPLGAATADFFRDSIQRPWFAYYLHGTGDGHFPEAWAFETGENAWHRFDAWPPRDARPRNVYLRGHGTIAFDPPASDEPGISAYDSYIADPAHPVPFEPRPITDDDWPTWLIRDQRFVGHDPGVLTWRSAPLTDDLTIAGDVVAHLFASTTGTDADWVVKLIDCYPDTVAGAPRQGGYQLIVNADILRGRYWKGFDHATPIPPDSVIAFTIDMHQQLYRFRKGHRVMIQVQSSWFPLYDRNPQTFVPSIFDAKASDFTRQEHRIWHSARYPSHLSVLVLP